MGVRFYIAAPFFNAEQIRVVQEIEAVFEICGVDYFSPRSQDSNKAPGPITPAKAKLIFNENISQMERTDATLAVVDWHLPPGQELRLVDQTTTPAGFASPPLNLPDTGTVWEMGATYCAGKPVYIYTTRPPEQGLNLMLTQGARGIVRGPEGLRRFLQGGAPREDALEQWQGRNR